MLPCGVMRARQPSRPTRPCGSLRTEPSLMSDLHPDLESDVVVRHVREADPAGETCDRWQVFVGRTKRSETANPQAALMCARLLADLIKRPVWVGHDPDGPLERLDPSSLRGCSCC